MPEHPEQPRREVPPVERIEQQRYTELEQSMGLGNPPPGTPHSPTNAEVYTVEVVQAQVASRLFQQLYPLKAKPAKSEIEGSEPDHQEEADTQSPLGLLQVVGMPLATMVLGIIFRLLAGSQMGGLTVLFGFVAVGAAIYRQWNSPQNSTRVINAVALLLGILLAGLLRGLFHL